MSFFLKATQDNENREALQKMLAGQENMNFQESDSALLFQKVIFGE